MKKFGQSVFCIGLAAIIFISSLLAATTKFDCMQKDKNNCELQCSKLCACCPTSNNLSLKTFRNSNLSSLKIISHTDDIDKCCVSKYTNIPFFISGLNKFDFAKNLFSMDLIFSTRNVICHYFKILLPVRGSPPIITIDRPLYILFKHFTI
jgi:hypothetical protein